MKISYKWIQQFLNLKLSPTKVSELLTNLGIEVESITSKEAVKGNLKGVVVGRVLTCEKHPNADRLKITTVDIGDENYPAQIICGAPNVASGQKVPVATLGTKLYDENDKHIIIKKGKIRGEESNGMICSEKELCLGNNYDGIMVLDQNLKEGTPIAEVFKLETDYIFDIELTPNRSDAMSHYGVARDLRVGLIQNNIKLELEKPSVSEFNVEKETFKIDIEVENKELVPRYCGITITDVTVKESPNWIKNKLKAIGQNPQNNIIDITNYVLHELGQPLHAFDAQKIKGNKIVVKNLEENTKITTLDEIERSLSCEDIIICDGYSNPLCIGGVFGGLNSRVTESTTSVFLESAYFNPVSIRKTAKRHNLNTDASFRFERGIDINLVEYALKRAALLIEKYADGKLASDITDIYHKKIEGFKVFLSYRNAYKLIGQEIIKKTIKSILASLEIKINRETEAGLKLTIPSYRTDVQREEDVVEEILRIYGYNNISFSHKLKTSVFYNSNDNIKTEDKVANQLTALGFNEIITNSLTKPTFNEMLKSVNNQSSINLINPLSYDLKAMRQSLLFSGLETLAYNINRKNNSLELFEFGKTYNKFENKYQESKRLSLIITGNKTIKGWNSNSKNYDFFYLKGIVLSVLEKLGLNKLKVADVKQDVFTEGMSLSQESVNLVEFGVVKSSLLKEFNIKQEVLFSDFNWDIILKLVSNIKIKVSELSKFPSVKRDLAIVIDSKVKFGEIYNLAFQTEKKLLKDVYLFDVYENSNKLPSGKKSYAVSFLLEDKNKTLTDKQIDKAMKKLLKTFQNNLGAVLR